MPLREVEDAFARLPVPDSIPAIAALHWDDSGHLWVERRTGDEQNRPADIIDRDGRWLGVVAFPPSLGRVLEIGDDYIIARATDELDVPYLSMHRIRKAELAPPVPGSR